MPSGAFVARRNGRIFVTGNSGFPKGIAVDKAIDNHFGKEREVVGDSPYANRRPRPGNGTTIHMPADASITAPATPEAAQWQGWHSALKPSWEPVIMAQKPVENGYANNALVHGVAGLNVDGCRIGTEQTVTQAKKGMHGTCSTQKKREQGFRPYRTEDRDYPETTNPPGRWPANLILDEAAAALLDEQSGERKSAGIYNGKKTQGRQGFLDGNVEPGFGYADTGGASRFFYVAKASSSERNEGLQGMEKRVINITEGHGLGAINTSKGDGTGIRENRPRANTHPTIKPLSLMRWLCRLTKTPWGGVVLDPFCGSGSTGVAAIMEGRSFIGIDTEAEYLAIAEARLAAASAQPFLFEVT